ncbi:DNA gyrase subunit A [Deferribacterales bacterium Es71-Z0220]|uniref:DNA gyrase subunit A n=1 Tax=Deferrivibrio essentukiensis TaxID=2880922 RepID=UPI001F61322E|nr:DNA gyrase subunit A [Deferrivibrio essentukiensis]MCB4204006.1 DNA gyrase subunit A [Deferrivibrio essentukiensis]
MEKNKGIIDISVEDSIKGSYLDYAMSVIVGRALPDVRDGLKPVHRRVLYAMHEMGVAHNKPFKKSARIVGDVIGKFHPHGDAAVYDTVVRLAQDFSMRYQLIDGQGNFGSVDGDSAAAMRYTEIRMSKIAEEMLADIDKETVDFIPNYDNSMVEPVVLPTKIPNLIINGTSGIAVGMATNIPPHNLREIIDALVYIIDNPDYSHEDIFKIVKGPDFPTAGIIMGISDIRNAYLTGRGSIKVRAKAEIEEFKNGKQQIIITQIPYLVNKATLIEKIAELVRDKKIVGITDLRDESDRDGIRVVIEVRRGELPDVILNQLYKFTQLETSFGFNMVALVDGKPQTLSLFKILEEFLNHRVVVVTRRTQYLLKKAEERLHILEGLKIAVENIDEVIKIIKSSNDTASAKLNLMNRFSFSDVQAQAILEMRLQKLTGLEIDKLLEEYKNTLKNIEYYKSILSSNKVLMGIIREELIEIKDKYGDERRTVIEADTEELLIEDLIPDSETVVTITHNGYIKRTLLSSFTSQRRGGKGKSATLSKGDDFVQKLILSTNHSKLLFFTNKGRIHFLKTYELPESAPGTRGRHIANLLSLESDEYIASAISVNESTKDKCIFMCTKYGTVKKVDIEQFKSGRSGMIAIKLKEGDEIIGSELTSDEDNIILATKKGKTLQFSSKDVRPMGRNAVGVKGISLSRDDRVVSMEVISGHPFILTVTSNGFGKCSLVTDYRIQNRGGKGLKLAKITEKTGPVVGARQVKMEDDIMLIVKSGKIIRISVSEIPVLGRDTQGVKLMNTGEDKIISIAVVKED